MIKWLKNLFKSKKQLYVEESIMKIRERVAQRNLEKAKELRLANYEARVYNSKTSVRQDENVDLLEVAAAVYLADSFLSSDNSYDSSSDSAE